MIARIQERISLTPCGHDHVGDIVEHPSTGSDDEDSLSTPIKWGTTLDETHQGNRLAQGGLVIPGRTLLLLGRPLGLDPSAIRRWNRGDHSTVDCVSAVPLESGTANGNASD